MIEMIKRCSICKSEECYGKEFKVSGTYSMGYEMTIDKIVCSSQVKRKSDGTYWYRLICGHGEWFDFQALPI